MGGKAGNLIAEPLGGNQSHLLKDLLVCVKIEGHSRVILLYDLARRFLYSFGADASHVESEREKKDTVVALGGWRSTQTLIESTLTTLPLQLQQIGKNH